MDIIRQTTDFALQSKTAVAIGKFDGIHLGHQKLLDELLSFRKQALLTVVFTFDPSPEAFFAGKLRDELMTREEKRAAFAALGADVLVEFPMTKESAATPPETFIRQYLSKQLNAAVIVAGDDVSFGQGGKGDAALLRRMEETGGYHLRLIDKVLLDGEEVSSTRIREAVQSGDMEKATALLGAPYQVSGRVIHGRKLGRKMGMPTVNILPPAGKLLPPAGVYWSDTQIGNKTYMSVTNIGCKPTVSDGQVKSAEPYLYDFDGDLYGMDISVSLLSFRRPEQKFPSLEALQAQMRRDISDGKRL